MKYELKSIGLWSVFKISFVLNFILGFMIGLFYAIFASAILSFYYKIGIDILQDMPGDPADALTIGMLVVFPLLFAVLGSVFNTIFVMIATLAYNIIVKVIGGIELDLAPLEGQQQLTTQAPQALVKSTMRQSNAEQFFPPPPIYATEEQKPISPTNPIPEVDSKEAPKEDDQKNDGSSNSAL